MFDATASNRLGGTRRSKVSIMSIMSIVITRSLLTKQSQSQTKECLSTNLSIPAFSRYIKSPLPSIHAVPSSPLRRNSEWDPRVGSSCWPNQRPWPHKCMVETTIMGSIDSTQEMTLIHMTPKEMVHYRHSGTIFWPHDGYIKLSNIGVS